MAHRLTIRGDSVESIRAKLLADHGPSARIVSVEKVTKGGIGGFMAKKYFEATVYAPNHPGVDPDSGMDLSSRLGIAALLADANDAEDTLSGRPAAPKFSTASEEFDTLIGELASRNADTGPVATETAAEPDSLGCDPRPSAFAVAPETLPTASVRPGDLTIIVGLGQESLAVATSMSKRLGACEVRGGGVIKTRGTESLTDRRSALVARADSVVKDKSIICAFGIEPGTDFGSVLEALNGDHVWFVADAGRKTADTKRWLTAISSRVTVDAIAVVNTAHTDTPLSVNELGHPIGWADGAPAVSPRL